MNSVVETWLPCKNLKLYEVSNIGNLRHKTSKHRRKFFDNGIGYLAVRLVDGKGSKNYYVHRLVAEAFVPNPSGFQEVNHIDSRKCNNAAINLEWCDRSSNIKHAITYGSFVPPNKGKFGRLHHAALKVVQYDFNMRHVKTWDSIMDAARALSLYSGHISECCKGKRKSEGKFMWKYFKEEAINNE